jgi:hypothetical protein
MNATETGRATTNPRMVRSTHRDNVNRAMRRPSPCTTREIELAPVPHFFFNYTATTESSRVGSVSAFGFAFVIRQ